MHELSIAMSIVEMAEQEAESRGGAQVLAVYLKLGDLSGVVKEALVSSYEMAVENTRLQGSRLVIESIPVTLNCRGCCKEQTLPSLQHFYCPECGAPASEVIHGKELEVVALELVQ